MCSLWLYKDWAEPMPTCDIDGHMREHGRETERKLASIRSLLSTTMKEKDLAMLGPRHMTRMTLGELQDVYNEWSQREGGVSNEWIRII